MKKAWAVVVGVGLLVLLAAVYGRFHGAPGVTIAHHHFAAGTFLQMANSLFLLGILLRMGGSEKP